MQPGESDTKRPILKPPEAPSVKHFRFGKAPLLLVRRE